jgi:hypothetical protein
MGKHPLYDSEGNYIYTVDQNKADELIRTGKATPSSYGAVGGTIQLAPDQPTWPWRLRANVGCIVFIVVPIVVGLTLNSNPTIACLLGGGLFVWIILKSV